MTQIDKHAKYRITENVVSREIDGEIIIVPLTSGIGDAEDDLFSLNDTGKAVWKYLDGSKTVEEITDILDREFESTDGDIAEDVIGFLEELYARKILETV